MLAIAGVPLVIGRLAASLMGQFDLGLPGFYPARVWGVMTNTLLMAVPLFVLMGVLLERSGLAERMLAVLSRMLGGTPARHHAVGAAVLDADRRLDRDHRRHHRDAGADQPAGDAGRRGAAAAGLGLICASGTLGQIIPPSILLVLLGDQIGNAYLEAQQKAGNFAIQPVSVGDLFAGALIPGLMLVGALRRASSPASCGPRKGGATTARASGAGGARSCPPSCRRSR